MKKTYSVTLALLLSLFIYVFYRSEKTLVNELIILLLSFDTYIALKTTITETIPLNKITIFSLPGGLWIFCVTILSQDFYMKIRDRKIRVAFIPIVFAVGLEFCQFIHVTNGRFDLWDLAFYFTFWVIAYYLFPSENSQQNITSPFTLHGFICLACFLSVYLAHVNR
jgi:hypothetical protein